MILLRYLSLTAIQIRVWLVYRSSYVVRLISAFLFVLIQYYFWQTVYVNNDVLVGVSREQIIKYIVFSFVISGFISSDVDGLLAEKFRSGDLAVDMLRPLNAQLAYFCTGLGNSIFHLAAVSFPLMILSRIFFDMSFPSDMRNLLAFCFTTSLGYLILFFVDFIIGTLTFWTKYAHGLNKFKRAIVGFFAGSLLPLDFFPLWLRQIAAALPFQGIYYIPLTLVTGLRDYKAVWSQVLLQMFWVVILSVLSYLLWSQAIKRVTIQGG